MNRNITRGVHGLIGSRNYATHDRVEHDFYSTGPGVIERLEKKYTLPHNVWECACGDGALSEQLIANGHSVTSTDLVNRGYGVSGVDFLETDFYKKGFDAIVTNPPYNIAKEFVVKALDIMRDNPKGVVAMFLKTQFLETKGRYDAIFKGNPPTHLFQFISRAKCLRNGYEDTGALMPFMWFVWDNSHRGEKTQLDWI